jgi:hypothetical protein
LTDRADEAAREVGFVRRVRKLSGSRFIQTLVWGFQATPAASYSDLSQSAATIGVEITPQGLEQRFTRQAACLAQRVLEDAVGQVISSRPAALALLQRFNGVHLRDSTVISLPGALAGVWPGVGGSQGATAALKLQVDLDFSSGRLQGPVLQSGRSHDTSSPFHGQVLPPGALQVADLGFFDLQALAADQQRGVYWITRLKFGTTVYDVSGRRLDVLPWLRAQGQAQLDLAVVVGKRERLPCRLLAVRVPPDVVARRRRRLREYAHKKQTPLTPERLAWAEWTLVITNVPLAQLSPAEALVLLGVRWQVELLFKLWKSHGLVDEWRSENPWRILCELYAKLIGLIILHWIALTSLWEYPARSLFKAAQAVRKHATALALTFHDLAELTRTLEALCKCLLATCRVNKRRTEPSTYQLLSSSP